MPKQLTQAVIEEWISLIKGKFSVRDIWNEVGIESPEGKHHLRTILNRLETKGIIVANGGGGQYRKIDTEAQVIAWQQADPNKVVSLKFPFSEHEVAKIYPKSIVIVAGSKNAGKTAYLYNFIKLNMSQFTIDLFNSETSPEQMHERFEPLDIPNPAPFTVYERYDNFADVIHPDHISVIDYLDLNSEVYLVGSEIDAIFRKLRTGVAVIGLQKPPPSVTYVKGVKKVIDRDLAYGGGFTAKRAVLYITMGENKLKLLYVKTPKQPKVNPNNMTFTYNVGEDGIHFANIQRYYGEATD
jgi:hypothetical protein